MEVATGVAANSVTEIGKYSVKSITRHVDYVYHFKKNIDDLVIAKGELKLKYDTLKVAVERAALNTEVVEKDVEDWLKNVEEIVKDVETLENKIQANKVCCNGWCPNWIWRYKQSKEAIEKTIAVKTLKVTGSFTQVAHRVPTPGLEIFPSSDFEAFDSRKSAFGDIMKALDDDNCSRIGVWGMGGVGKTTLVKEGYKKAKALGRFNDIAMAVVSQTPDIRKIQNEIAGHLKDFKLEENDETERARRICLRIKEAKKILIILDDIWKEVNFEDIGIPSCNDHKGCKILITTRSEHVCNVMSCEKKVQLKVMTEEESLALFKKSARIDDDSLAINDDVVRQVVKECQGLPIAIVVVGKALIKKSPKDWEAALDNLRKSKLTKIEGVCEDENAYLCLKWSYDHLKPNTKLCFFLCSLFPEDHYIYIEELIIYVTGLEEEYEEVKSNIEEVRRQVYAAINSLKDSSLLLDVDNEEYVKMHDVVRDVALWIASKGDNEFSMRAYTSLKGINRFESVTAISLWANNAKQFDQDKLVCPKLNILLLGEDSNNDELQEISDTMFEGMKGLKVLSLYNKFLSSQSLQFLTNLRSLYLENCNFDDLCSLGKLKSLEILSFRDCRMVALPNELGGLNNLKVLQLLGCRQLERILPNLIQGLSQLEELRVDSESFKNWEVEGTSIERRNASLSELMSLSNLAVLYLEDIEEKSLPMGFVFPALQRYEISVGFGYRVYYSERFLGFTKVNASSSFNVFNVLFCTVEYLQLDACKVQCFDDTILGRINNTKFSNLVRLKLRDCRSLTNLFSLSLVQNLKKLDTLILEGCIELKQIISEEELLFKHHHIQCFPKLRILRVTNCKKLEFLFSISVARGFLLQLEELIIENLLKLKQVFGNEREGEVGLDENKFELSKLRKLSLYNLPKLSNFFQGNTSSTWLSLEELSLTSCPKLTPSVVAHLIDILQAIEKRYVISIGSNFTRDDYSKSRVLRLVDVDAASLNMFKVFFYVVEVLELKKCEVESFIDTTGGNNISTFSNLVELKLEGCNKLTNLFSPSLIQNLEKLEILILERCSELKQIILEEEILFMCHDFQCFPKLRILQVTNCEKLEYLFSISVARGFLQQLEELKIKELPELKQVFSNEREGEVGLDKNKFELSKLRKLSLCNLPKLSNFFQGNTSSTWLSLEELSVTSCPKMTPSFVAQLIVSLQAVGKKYDISIGNDFPMYYSKSRVLRLVDVDAASLNVFKVFFHTVEVLELEKCEVESFIDTTGGNNIPTFSNLVKLKLNGCNRLTNLFSLSFIQNLEKLETLILERCSELKQIISEEEMLFQCHHIQPPRFPKLRVLEVIDCRKLEYLFSISVARGFLRQLKELKIEDLPELKQVFGDEREGVGLDGNKFELFELRQLSLHNLPKLSNFFQENTSSTWLSLEELSVTSCPKLMSPFLADLAVSLQAVEKKLQAFNVSNCSQLCNTVLDLLSQGLLDLEELKIESCGGLEDLFQRERLLPSSRLKILSLKDVLVQKCVWKGPTQLVNLNNLKKFEVCRCNKLRQLFSSATLAQSLQQLESLTIEECDELEHLIAEDEEDQILAEGHLQPLYFPKLCDVNIKECNKIKSLFPITIVNILQQLWNLKVEGASQLVEVFAHEDEGDVKIRKDIGLPRLRKLTLVRLPSLVSFCPRNYHFILPNISELKVLSCPDMSVSFSRTPNRIVHVNGKVPQLGEKDEPPNEDIDWNQHSKFDALPLLKEEPQK